MEMDLKEVNFKKYCEKCKNVDVEDWENPCSECICDGFRVGTEVPLHYDGPKLVKATPGMKEKLGL